MNSNYTGIVYGNSANGSGDVNAGYGVAASTNAADNNNNTVTVMATLTASDAKPIAVSNDFLDVQVFPAEGTFSVKDKRTGRTWTQSVKNKSFIALPKKSVADSDVSFSMVNTETLFEYNVSIQLEKSLPELSVKIDGSGVLNGYVQYPAPFDSQTGSGVIVFTALQS